MISPFADIGAQQRHFFPPDTSPHPRRVLHDLVLANLRTHHCVLDIGCGRTAPDLHALRGKAQTLIGIDIIPFEAEESDLRLLQQDAGNMSGIETDSVDIAFSRAMMEHAEDPEAVLKEIERVLVPGGVYMFITPSIYDYGSLVAAVVPNRFHGTVVNVTSGRAHRDVFPTRFRANSRRAIERLAKTSGLEVAEFRFLGQYPAYLKFSRVLFWLGSVYQKFIERHAILHPLQGWILCVLRKPSTSPTGDTQPRR